MTPLLVGLVLFLMAVLYAMFQDRKKKDGDEKT